MAKYQILEPCAYAVDGVGVQHTEPGAVVELDAATAEALGQSVDRLSPAGADAGANLADWLAAENAYNADVEAWLNAEKAHARKR